MKSKPRFVIAPRADEDHNYAKRMPLARLSNVTAEAIKEGRATYVSPSGMRAKLIPA